MASGKGCGICKLVTILGGLGALNWGLIAVFNFNLVTRLFGELSTASRIVYTVIGIAGLLQLISLVKSCPCCTKGMCGPTT